MLNFAGFVLSQVYKTLILDTVWKTGVGMAFGREVCTFRSLLLTCPFFPIHGFVCICVFCKVLNMMFLVQMGIFFFVFYAVAM